MLIEPWGERLWVTYGALHWLGNGRGLGKGVGGLECAAGGDRHEGLPSPPPPTERTTSSSMSHCCICVTLCRLQETPGRSTAELEAVAARRPACLASSINLGVVDFYPAASGKDGAAAHLLQRWGIAPDRRHDSKRRDSCIKGAHGATAVCPLCYVRSLIPI